MEFIGSWNGYTILKTENGEYVVEETMRCFSTKEEAFHRCIIGDVQ